MQHTLKGEFGYVRTRYITKKRHLYHALPSISSTFYVRIYCTNVISAAYMQLEKTTFIRKTWAYKVDEIDTWCRFHQHFTCTFLYEWLFLATFWQKKALSYKKCAHKMLMKLTPGKIPCAFKISYPTVSEKTFLIDAKLRFNKSLHTLLLINCSRSKL